jgi:hypothetical protein
MHNHTGTHLDTFSHVYRENSVYVRGHRVATRSRRVSWRSVSFSSSIFLWTLLPISAIKRLAV